MSLMYYSSGFSSLFHSYRDRFTQYYDRPFYAELNGGSNLQEIYRHRLVVKNQRAAAQSKRHKSRHIHVPVDKDVPQKILNFINRACVLE
jgi:uncharacterized protein (DUF58 family)